VGTDSAHPGFGSFLDGGRAPNGVEIPGPLGSYDWNQVVLDIESELRRIEREYKARQSARMDGDIGRYRNVTLVPEEVLVSLSEIRFQQVMDTLFVEIKLLTATNIEQTLRIPVGTAPITL
jgi:hypothetical protein